MITTYITADSLSSISSNTSGEAHDEIQVDAETRTLDVTARIDYSLYCEHCSQPVVEYVEGWVHEYTNDSYCDPDENPDNIDEDTIEELLEDHAGSREAWQAGWHHDHSTASPENSAPANWVGFTIDEQRERIELQLSIGDPRGALTFELRRAVLNEETGETQLLLHMPYEGQGASHVELEHIADGTFRVR